MKNLDREKKLAEMKKRLLHVFPGVKIVNEYNKNDTAVIEIYTPDKNKDDINKLGGELSTETLLKYGVDVLVLVYDNPKVLEWFKV